MLITAQQPCVYINSENKRQSSIGSLFLKGHKSAQDINKLPINLSNSLNKLKNFPSSFSLNNTNKLDNDNSSINTKLNKANPIKATLKKASMFIGIAPLITPFKGDFYADVLEEEHVHAVPIDLDEFIHALYAAIKGNQGHAGADSAYHSLINNQAINHAGQEVSIHGDAMSLLATTPIAAVMLIFSYKAIKAGLGELAEAHEKISDILLEQINNNKNNAIFEQILSRLEEKINEIHNPQEKNKYYGLYTLLKTNQDLIKQQMKQQLENLKLAKLDKHIAKSSLYSGSVIAGKVMLDLIMKLGSLAVANPAFNTALSVFGAINTLVLGPLAGACATSLGIAASIKTAKQIKLLKKQIAGVKERFKDINILTNHNQDKQIIQDALKNYMQFHDKKAKFRQNFFSKYFVFNLIFTLGSGFYALSATAQAVLLGCAIAGVTAAPIPFGVLIGIFGGIMGIGSLAFLLGHPKQHEYDDKQEQLKEDELVKFYLILENLKISSKSSNENNIQKYDKLKNLALKDRALRFNSMKTMFDNIQNLSSEIAKDKQLKYKVTKFSEDKEPSLLGSVKNTGTKILGSLSKVTLKQAYKATHWKASPEQAQEFAQNIHHKIFKHKYITQQQLAAGIENYNSDEIAQTIKNYLINEQEIVRNKQEQLTTLQQVMPFIKSENIENSVLIDKIKEKIVAYNSIINNPDRIWAKHLSKEKLLGDISQKIIYYNNLNSNKINTENNAGLLSLNIDNEIDFSLKNDENNEAFLVANSITPIIKQLEITKDEEYLANLDLNDISNNDVMGYFVKYKNLSTNDKNISNSSNSFIEKDKNQSIVANYFAYTLKSEYKQRRSYWFNVELVLSRATN